MLWLSNHVAHWVAMAFEAASPLVGFMNAGVQKAGTTALHRFLGHSQIYMPDCKDLFFCQSTVTNSRGKR